MVIDNSREGERSNKQTSTIKTSLEEHFGLKFFQDFVGEDGLPDDFNYFTLETGEIEIITEPKYSVGRNLYLAFYPENREGSTGDSLDIILLVQDHSIRFQRTDPNHLRLENQNRYIDQLAFTFRRLLKSDCHD